jgi:signal transduction histidine kinase
MPAWKEERDGYLARYQKTILPHSSGIGREVDATRKDGTMFPVDLNVSEIAHLNLFTGILRDITYRKELERDILDIASLEQRRIGQDLHDHCGQELTAIGLLADGLLKSMERQEPNVPDIARKVGQGVRSVLQSIRNISWGLMQVEISPSQLQVALNELVARLSETSADVHCVFSGDANVPVYDTLRATQIFHIAQEACNNAIKHSQAKNVQVHLRASNQEIVLRIRDDGIGMPEERENGLGTRIMYNRASLIGAKLVIEPAKPRGTTLTCTLKDK